MMNKFGVAFVLGLLTAPFAAHATVVTFNYTADNVLSVWGECAVPSCQFPAHRYGPGPNGGNWQAADTLAVNLGPGTYSFAFFVQNTGPGSNINPGGFLAEVLWDSNAFRSSSAWDVALCPDTNPDSCNFFGWTAATEYGLNGGPNIWTINNGGPISGISTEASWIWSDANFSENMDQNVAFRVTFKVPEPATLALLGLGLAGLGFMRRKKA